MAVKGNLKKREEVHCQKCHGRMAFEKFYGPGDIFFSWPFLICGDILDPVNPLHRVRLIRTRVRADQI